MSDEVSASVDTDQYALRVKEELEIKNDLYGSVFVGNTYNIGGVTARKISYFVFNPSGIALGAEGYVFVRNGRGWFIFFYARDYVKDGEFFKKMLDTFRFTD